MQVVDKKFGFRKTKDDAGNEIAAPEPVVLKTTLLDIEGVIELLKSEDDKVLEMVVDSLNTPILGYIRQLIEDIGVEKVRAEGLDPSLYSFQLIANLPAASKTVFDEDTWNAFKADYIEVIVANGVDVPRAKVGAEILAGRLNKVKGNKTALEQFRDRIKTWYNNSSKAEEMQKVYQYLIGRCEEYIKANEPEAVLASF